MKKLLLITGIALALLNSVAMATKSKSVSATLYVDSQSQQLFQIKTIRLYVPGSTAIPRLCILKGNQCPLNLTTDYIIAGASDSLIYSNSMCENSNLKLKAGDNYLVIQGSAKDNDVKCSLSQTP